MASESLPAPQAGVRLTALSLADAAKVLSRSGAKAMTEELLRQDVAAGAPVNADGTVNLVHYAAWLAKDLAHGD